MRTKKTVIVLISGKAGAGKTTLKDLLIQNLKAFDSNLQVQSYSFANPLKYIAQAFAGWNKEKDEKGRKLLQDIGRIFREYDEHIWIKHLLNQLDKSKEIFPDNFILIDDWRFPNEANYLKDNPMFDLYKIRVTGRGGLETELANDISEVALSDDDLAYYSATIDNSTNLEDLVLNADALAKALKETYILE